MKLTWKCKNEFEKWYIPYLRKQRPDYDRFDDGRLIRKFYRMTESMQQGVYVDFFDSVDIQLCAGKFGYSVTTREEHVNQKYNINTYNKSRTAAVEKADEIFNKRQI